MQDTFGAVSYTDVGINGAFCTTFTRPDRIADIAALHPDLLILSFGTNESHNRRYNTMLHYRQMDDLVRMLREKLPNVPMLMTTPPALTRVSGSVAVVEPIRLIRVLPLPCRLSAAMPMKTDWRYGTCTNTWRYPPCLPRTGEAGLMRPDHVHYLPDGYRLQGELFYQALLKAYNDYVEY